MIKFIAIILLLVTTQSCYPLVGFVGVASLGSVSKEKGIGTTINDTLIHTRISNLIFKFNPDLIADTRVIVNNGTVLLTGKVKKASDRIELTQIAWKIKYVKQVNNEIQITDISNIKNIARDIASMGEIRARLITDKRINSLNFSIDVVNDKAYIAGVAQDKKEMKFVQEQASSARFVKEVFNYIIINNDNR